MLTRSTLSTAARLAVVALLVVGCAGGKPSPTTVEPAQSPTQAQEAPTSAPTREATAEPAEAPADMPSPAPATATPAPTATEAQAVGPLTLSDNPDNDLLFYITQEDGTRIYYYGVEEDGAMVLTHTIFEDGSGELYTVIYGPNLVPIQWILPEMTIAVYPTVSPEEVLGEEAPAGEPFEGRGFVEGFNPHQAVHVTVRGGEEEAFVADIFPGDLLPVVEAMEAATGDTFAGARAFLDAYPATYDELVALAEEAGPEQPRYIAAAAGFSAAWAAVNLSEVAGDLAVAPKVAGIAAPARVIFGDVIKVGAGALGGAVADALGAGLDPGDGPAVGVLLCRGAAKYSTCHYMFFRSDQLGECVSFCQTSLGCFTDICMPMDISADMAMGLGGEFR